MVAITGHVGPFVEGQEKWYQYTDRDENFFKENEKAGEGKQLVTFLSLIKPQNQ